MVPQNGANLGNWGSKFCDPQNGTSLRGTTFWQIFLHYRRGSPYLSEKSSDFDEIWYNTADIEHDDSHMTKN